MEVVITTSKDSITKVTFKSKGQKTRLSPLEKKAYQQIKEYSEEKRKNFTLPLNPSGTDFQKKVWKTILKIPYGEVRTYKQVAKMINKPKAARAVGNALGKNPIPLIIPCHRVVAQNGLGGFSIGIDIKKKLLKLEAHSKS